jgi:hypothetical protein
MTFGGMHAGASGSGLLLGISSLAPNNPSAHLSMNNRAYSNTFPSTSSLSSYYHGSSTPDTAPNDNRQSPKPNEFAFAHASELAHFSHSGNTLFGQGSENSGEHTSSLMSSSFHNPFQ